MSCNMKGVLVYKNKEWFVETEIGNKFVPLHPSDQTWMDGYNLYEGKEIEYELFDEFTNPEYYEEVSLFDGTIYGKLINYD